VLNQVKGTTGVLGIIGYPVRHSLSPIMQNSALQACELDYVYVPFEVAPDSLEAAVAGMKALGVKGFNVTIPHKTEVMKYLDDLDPGAELAGAVNTVKVEAGRLIGFNTDGEGLVRSLVREFGFVPREASIALVGAGGAARGAISALCRAGAGRVVIANRTSQKAVELVSMMAKQFPLTELTVAKDFEEIEEYLAQADILINTTSLGMHHDDGQIVRLDNLRQGAVVNDMVYYSGGTRLLNDAHRLGYRYTNGLGMLAAQGELGFAIWTGRMPPDGLMKGVLDGICNT
jgi:shikimate dehydrogenase